MQYIMPRGYIIRLYKCKCTYSMILYDSMIFCEQHILWLMLAHSLIP